MPKNKFLIPFKSGEMVQYQYEFGIEEHVENYEWYDELYYKGYGRGRSADYFIWKSIISCKRYYMFMTDMDNILKTNDLIDRSIKGTFTFTKRGCNFGIKLIGD